MSSLIWDGEDYLHLVWQDWLSDPEGALLVGEYAGQIVSTAKLTRLGYQSWWLEGMRVLPEFEGRGFASHVFEEILDACARLGGGIARLATGSKRTAVHRMCARLFRHDERVLLCSSYQYPLYPDMNPPSVPGRIVNCPLPAGSGGDVCRAAITEHWLPALEAFRPQLVFISAGFDAHAADPLADLRLSGSDYGWITEQACQVANRDAHGRVVSTLEGGYDPAGTRDQRRDPHRQAPARLSAFAGPLAVIRSTATGRPGAPGP